MKRPGAHQHNAESAECRTDNTPEKVLCIDDRGFESLALLQPNGPVQRGKVYHVLQSGVFDQVGTPAYRLLGYPALSRKGGIDLGWKACRFKKLR